MDREEKVLEFLFFWERPISPGNLRKHLDMKHSTLNSVLKRLEKDKMVNWEKYGSVTLTKHGKKKAGHLSNHHFIVEKFLIETLDIPEKKAHEEALELSPHISCTLIEAISKKMGFSVDKINKSFCSERNYK